MFAGRKSSMYSLENTGGQPKRGGRRGRTPAACRGGAPAGHGAHQRLSFSQPQTVCEVRAYGEWGLQALPVCIREGHLCWAVPRPLRQLRFCPFYLSSTLVPVPIASRVGPVPQTLQTEFVLPSQRNYFYALHDCFAKFYMNSESIVYYSV